MLYLKKNVLALLLCLYSIICFSQEQCDCNEVLINCDELISTNISIVVKQNKKLLKFQCVKTMRIYVNDDSGNEIEKNRLNISEKIMFVKLSKKFKNKVHHYNEKFYNLTFNSKGEIDMIRYVYFPENK